MFLFLTLLVFLSVVSVQSNGHRGPGDHGPQETIMPYPREIPYRDKMELVQLGKSFLRTVPQLIEQQNRMLQSMMYVGLPMGVSNIFLYKGFYISYVFQPYSQQTKPQTKLVHFCIK